MKDGEKVHESFNIFVQVNSRLLEFLMRWLLVLDLKECLAECATVCVKSVVILTIPRYRAQLSRLSSSLFDCVFFKMLDVFRSFQKSFGMKN